MIEELNGESLRVGLKMNLKKTKMMFNNQLAGQQIMIGNETLERVEEYITWDRQLVQTLPKTEKSREE